MTITKCQRREDAACGEVGPLFVAAHEAVDHVALAEKLLREQAGRHRHRVAPDRARGNAPPPLERAAYAALAPLSYRAVFTDEPLIPAWARNLVSHLLPG
ncbi:hypothetical protein [Streptomyces subrutilus]|uniref:hypothetical protein n=1 Tax=Streptomyces subrutilus TaxID=36818 RepID=UPI0033DF1703